MIDLCLSCPLPDCDEADPRCALNPRASQRERNRRYRARWRKANPLRYIAEDLSRKSEQRVERALRALQAKARAA